MTPPTHLLESPTHLAAAVRWMTGSDVPAALYIEDMCHSDPWDSEGFQLAMRNGSSFAIAATHGRRLVGYLFFVTHGEGDLEVVNLTIHPDFQRQGIGAQLLDFLSETDPCLVWTVILETNVAAQYFFRDQGFRLARVVPDYNHGVRGYIMEKPVN